MVRQGLRWAGRWALFTAMLAAAGMPVPAAAGGPGTPPPLAACVVVEVRDATDLVLRCAGGRLEVRLPGVVAPRPGPPLLGGEPYGDASVEEARRWLGGLRLVRDGRTLRAGGSDVRHELLARGLVQLARGAAATLPAELAAAERSARQRQLGVWSHEAWRRHQSDLTLALDLPAPPPPPPLGAVAERLARHSREERRAAFDAALAALEARPPDAALAPPRR